jgi:ComF family protein
LFLKNEFRKGSYPLCCGRDHRPWPAGASPLSSVGSRFPVAEKIEGYRKKRVHYAMFDGDCKGCITAGKKNLAGDRYIPGQANLADTDKHEPHGPLFSPGGTGNQKKLAPNKPVLHTLLDILFPARCVVCGTPPGDKAKVPLCCQCQATITRIEAPFCRVCGRELFSEPDRQPLCGDCLTDPPPFTLARAPVHYEGAVRQLIRLLKYQGDTAVIPVLRDLVAGYDMQTFADCRWIVPVPLHQQRLRRRGLNQAAILAGHFFVDRRKDILLDGLVRVRNTLPQAGLDGVARRKNLRGAFRVIKAQQIDGTAICLVDDVFTTGTTAGECSRALCAAGAETVKVLTLARVATDGRGGW